MNPLPLERIYLLAVPSHSGLETISLADFFRNQSHFDGVVWRSREAHQVSIPHGPPRARVLGAVVQRGEVHPSEGDDVFVQLKV